MRLAIFFRQQAFHWHICLYCNGHDFSTETNGCWSTFAPSVSFAAPLVPQISSPGIYAPEALRVLRAPHRATLPRLIQGPSGKLHDVFLGAFEGLVPFSSWLKGTGNQHTIGA